MSLLSEANRIMALKKRLATRLVQLGIPGVSDSSSLQVCVEALEAYSMSSLQYTVKTASGAAYGFELNSNKYYESKNRGVPSSAAVCVLTIVAKGSFNVSLDCISYGENNYDYGIISKKNKTLSVSNTADSTNVLKSFRGLSSANVQTVSLGTVADETATWYIKYIKDGSADSNNDTLQFKVVYN